MEARVLSEWWPDIWMSALRFPSLSNHRPQPPPPALGYLLAPGAATAVCVPGRAAPRGAGAGFPIGCQGHLRWLTAPGLPFSPPQQLPPPPLLPRTPAWCRDLALQPCQALHCWTRGPGRKEPLWPKLSFLLCFKLVSTGALRSRPIFLQPDVSTKPLKTLASARFQGMEQPSALLPWDDGGC